MRESTLRNIALLSTVTGLILLFLISNQIQPVVDINTISIDDVGRGMRVCGTISSRKISNNHIFLDLKDSSGSARFVMFNSTALRLNETGISPYKLEEGAEVCVPGVVDEYPKGSGIIELVYRRGMIEIL
jgi:exonuclease VII large subunit